MAKSAQRLEAINLRKQGESVRDISKKVGVAKSTVSLWTRDIILSVDQLEKLRQKRLIGQEKGSLLGALKQKNARLLKAKIYKTQGELEFKVLTPREVLIAGLSLYWAEGSKKQRRIELCNSDAQMIKFFLHWLKTSYDIPIEEISCYVGINEAHKKREADVRKYWSDQTGIPLSNFAKTSFKKYPLKKVFENFNEHFGTLSVKVKSPARIFYKIIGQIHGISMAT